MMHSEDLGPICGGDRQETVGVRSSSQQTYHEWTHFSSALRDLGEHCEGDGIGGEADFVAIPHRFCVRRHVRLQVWMVEVRKQVSAPGSTGQSDCVHSPALFRHPRHVHHIPFPLYLQLDKGKGECLAYPFVSLRMYSVVPYYMIPYMRSTLQNRSESPSHALAYLVFLPRLTPLSPLSPGLNSLR